MDLEADLKAHRSCGMAPLATQYIGRPYEMHFPGPRRSLGWARGLALGRSIPQPPALLLESTVVHGLPAPHSAALNIVRLHLDLPCTSFSPTLGEHRPHIWGALLCTPYKPAVPTGGPLHAAQGQWHPLLDLCTSHTAGCVPCGPCAHRIGRGELTAGPIPALAPAHALTPTLAPTLAPGWCPL